ncbi:MAG: amino acid ABC transporter permease [Azospirillaceae bacterium]
MDYNLNFAAVWRSFDLLLGGLGLGLFLAVVSIFIGCLIGIVAAFASFSKSRAIRGTASGYVTVVRNLPILVIVLFVYFGLPETGITMGKIESFVFSLSIYAGAYLTEVFRAGLLAVPKTVTEAGYAIGLRPLQVKRYVVFPIMLRNALPSMGNNFISLFKDTSLAAAIAVPELTFHARKINVETFRVIETWLVASLLYVATCYLIAMVLRRIERRYALM